MSKDIAYEGSYRGRLLAEAARLRAAGPTGLAPALEVRFVAASTFLALPDRGPNAAVYNTAIDNTTSYISRFHTVDLALTATSSGSLPYTLTPTLQSTTLLWSSTALNYGSAPVPTANTSGTGTDTGNAVATYTPTVGSQYLYGEILLPGSASTFAQYIGTGTCVNTLPTAQGGSNVNIGMGYDIGPIQYGDDITCTITNTPKAPALSLSKALGGTGRVGSDDQFTLAIKTGGLHGTVVAQTTTAGTGTLVSNGSASLGSAALATAYTLTEAGSNGSNLKRYSSTLSCTDSAGVQKTGLPSGQAFDPSVGYTLTPEAGANIVCTLTNSPRAPQIRVTKALGGPRISDDDQFVVAIYQAPGGGLLASTTTTGTGSTVGNATITATGQIGMRYMVGESMRAGSPSNIEQYRYPLSCTNTLSTAEGGTDVSMVGLGQLFGLPNNPTDLVAGDDIACVLTNIPKSASLSLSKALGSTGRVNAGDQFTLKIKTGGVNGTDLASATTSGLGTSASGSASLNPASPGTTYTLTEAPANGAVLAQYTATIRCVDSAGFQTGLPEGAPFDPNQGLNIAPVPGANIACTLTNTAIASLTITGKVFLDVGAGSGSVAIEWMRAARGAHAVAFEREGERLQNIAVNAAALGVPGIEIVPGEAPASFGDYPLPDAVFLGGDVANDNLFDACWTALRPGGRLVANAVTLDGERAIIERQEQLGGDITRLDFSTLDKVGGRRVLRPRMAVTQWCVTKLAHGEAAEP
mgnify:CR=1 FL=1